MSNLEYPKEQTVLDLYVEVTYSDLVVLSFGGGQDSTTILFKLVLDKVFRAKYIKENGKLLVLFADTHNEHPETYKYMDDIIKPFCKEHNIEFVHIDNTMGYHSKTWQSLTGQWEHKSPTIGAICYPKSCTHNLKLLPQYNYVEKWLPKKYSKINNKAKKDNYVQFAKYYGKIIWLIGIAKGEEKRCVDASKETAKWKKAAIEIKYPLIEFGLDRQACQDYIKSINKPIPMPSNCMYCPFSCNYMELMWLEKAYPNRFDEWVDYEQAKLDANENLFKEVKQFYIYNSKGAKKYINIEKDVYIYNNSKGQFIQIDNEPHITKMEQINSEIITVPVKNLGVSGKLHKDGERKGKAVTLRDMLALAKEKYPNVTLNELNEWKWSHGHLVCSKY